MNKKVSIIIPCYNQAKYVAESIMSALNQTYDNTEIVIVNDGSTDNSSEIIKTFADENENILFIDNKDNNGVIYARNTAIDACSGEYILPLDADDTIDSTYLEKATKILDENSDIGIVYGKAKYFGIKNEIVNLPAFDKSEMLYRNHIFCTALFRKSDFIKVGKYKEYMKNGCEDFELWLSFIEQGLNVYCIDEILLNYRIYEEESRSDLNLKNQDKVWKQIIKNHINLYLEDKQFLNRLVYTIPAEVKAKIEALREKHKKYKQLFNITFVISIIEFIFIMFLIIYILKLYK